MINDGERIVIGVTRISWRASRAPPIPFLKDLPSVVKTGQIVKGVAVLLSSSRHSRQCMDDVRFVAPIYGYYISREVAAMLGLAERQTSTNDK